MRQPKTHHLAWGGGGGAGGSNSYLTKDGQVFGLSLHCTAALTTNSYLTKDGQVFGLSLHCTAALTTGFNICFFFVFFFSLII